MNKRFFLKHPVLAALILPVLAEVWVSIPTLFPVAIGLGEDKKAMLVAYLLCVVSALLLLLMHKHHYRPAYRGSFRKEGLSDQMAWISIGIFLALDLGLCIFDGVKEGFQPFDLTFLIPSLNAGVCEETAFRVIPLSVIMYSCRKKESSWPALLLTAVVFGLFHLLNLKGGAALNITILQVITAGVSGLFLGALYLRTGNILLSMLVHTVHDLIAFFENGGYSALVMDVTADMIIEVSVLSLAELVCVFLLMRDQDKIHIPVWEERWSGAK